MIILGISPLDKDATVTLMADGRVVAAIAEERLSRKKMHVGFPHQALELVMKTAGVSARDIDEVAYAFLPWRDETHAMTAGLAASAGVLSRDMPDWNQAVRQARQTIRKRPLPDKVDGLPSPNARMEKSWPKRLAYSLLTGSKTITRWNHVRQHRRWVRLASNAHRHHQIELENALKTYNLDQKLVRIPHHLTHEANAFFGAGWESALIVTLDGYGTGLSGSIALGEGMNITRLDELDFPTSLGTFYETVTSALGFRPGRHEGKIVGLAAYGDPSILSDALLRGFRFADDDRRLSMITPQDIYLARRLACVFARIDVAAAYQSVLEDVAVRWVTAHVVRTGAKALVLSGGVVANVKLNQRLGEIPGIEKIYVHPNMGDGGCGTGAAMWRFREHGIRPLPMPRVDLGPDYDDNRMENALRNANIPFLRPENLADAVADRLHAGRVVARCQGRMEYGPRALGQRSIMCQARDPGINQWLNARLGRTEFMPFAPATLFEHRHNCYNNVAGAELAARFMTVTLDCTPAMKADCPAAVHIDGTARPQLVDPETYPDFHSILTAFHARTGVPSLINTSFNMHEEPIVCTPEDAVRAYVQGRLDDLALGPFLTKIPPAP